MEAHNTAPSGFFLTDETSGEQHDLVNGAVIGRTTGEMLFPLDIRMSGKHARITVDGSDVYIEDLTSRNGVIINSKRIEAGKPVRIYPGDIIVMGNHTFGVGRHAGTPSGASLRNREDTANTNTAVLADIKPPLRAVEKSRAQIPEPGLLDPLNSIIDRLKETDAENPVNERDEAAKPFVFRHPGIVLMLLAMTVGYLLTAINGGDLLHPSINDLIRWGANYGPRTTNGEWWRILTSAFIHSSSLHFFVHCLVLWQSGVIISRSGGEAAFLGIALLTQAFVGCLALITQPEIVFVGASAAAIGCFTAAITVTLRNPEAKGTTSRGVLMFAIAILVSANLGTGLASVEDIYLFALAGATGMVLSVIMVPAEDWASIPIWLRYGRPLSIVLFFSCALYLVFPRIPQISDSNDQLARLVENITPLAQSHDELREKILSGAMAPAVAIQTIQSEQLPKLREFEKELVAFPPFADKRKEAMSEMKIAVRSWIEAWELYIDAINSADPKTITKAVETEKQGFLAIEKAIKNFSASHQSAQLTAKPQ